MPKRLTVALVRSAGPGKYYDEHGLFLRVHPGGSRQWMQRIVIRGKRTDLGLGGWPVVSLAEARQCAFENRKTARAGGDPLAEKRRLDIPTFEEAAERVIALHSQTWKHAGKSKAQWESSLAAYALPRLGRMRVDQIQPLDIIGVLTPIWVPKHETAKRVRQRISAIMQWSVAQNFRTDDPAGPVLNGALPKPNGTKHHHRALPHGEVAAAIATVHASGMATATKLAIEFLILTATRSGEVRGARWEEVDLAEQVWTVPSARMKAKRDHRVPLGDRAVAVLREAMELSDGSGIVFPSATGRVISDNTLSKLLRENKVPCLIHGFRSSFRDWCSDQTDVPREVAESALAHTVSDSTERAYRRTDLFNRRRALIAQWAAYLSS